MNKSIAIVQFATISDLSGRIRVNCHVLSVIIPGNSQS